MGSPSNSSAKRLALVVVLALGLSFAVLHYYLDETATSVTDALGTASPTTPVQPTAAASAASAAAAVEESVAAASLPDTSETTPAGPGVEVAPGNEEGPLLPFLTRESFGHKAGLHKVKTDVQLSASAALVIDQDSGKVLLHKNGESVLPIASLTKLMTALVIAEAKLPMDETITITEDDVDGERHSRSRLRVGTTLTRSEALQLALMSSENRAAHALGRTYPAGLKAFVQAMNKTAAALGMKNTTYVDPTGLATGNQSTAQDLALLAAAAAKHQVLAQYSTTPQHLLPVERGRTLVYNNSNRLVKSPNWEILLQKTGYIVEAGWCMLLDTKIGDHKLFVVLLDAGGASSRLGDAERIRHWASAQLGVPVKNVAPPRQKARKAQKPQKGERK